MAVQWMDNFQQYGTTAANLLNGPYAEASGVSVTTDPDATAGGTKVLLIPDLASFTGNFLGNRIRKVLPTATATAGVMLRLWMNALPAGVDANPQPFVFSDANNTSQVTLTVTPTGSIKVYRGTVGSGGTGGTLLGESTNAIVANAWQHIEVKVSISSTVGTVEIRVDTVSVLNLSGLNTQNGLTTIASIQSANRSGIATSPNYYIKDFAIWDTTGALNTNFLGSCFVYSMRPDSDVSGTWSIIGGAGSAFASINESNPDDDTKYIYSPWPAATADILTVSDLPADATSVKALMTYHRSRKSDGGDGNLQTGLVSGASTGLGSDRPITTAYTYWSDVFETDPATGAQWTVAATNAVKLKLNRTL